MAVKKKSEANAGGASATGAVTAQLITVDAGKLSRGLKTTFEGVSMVFDSIGVPVEMPAETGAVEIGTAVENTVVRPADGLVSAPVATIEREEKGDQGTKSEPVSAADAQMESVTAKETTEEAELVAPAEEPEAPAAAASSITIDDITKIIVQKIKQNRKNNEKIAGILKSYEVTKVSELPTSKYEAFLTDLSAI